jgi:hypothetical protein
MDEKTKKLLGSATVTVASLGLASLPGAADPPDGTIARVANDVTNHLNSESDLLVELVLRTGGSQSAEAINRELRLMLSHMTPERFAQVLTLVKDLRSLGLSEEAQEIVLEALIDLLASAELPLNETQIEQLAAALIVDPERASLAKPEQSEEGRVPDVGGGRGVGLYEG